MKRSEMIELLSEFVISVNSTYNKDEAKSVAETWFNELMKTGIAPPETKVLRTRDFGEGLTLSYIEKERVWEND